MHKRRTLWHFLMKSLSFHYTLFPSGTRTVVALLNRIGGFNPGCINQVPQLSRCSRKLLVPKDLPLECLYR
jgi:hypothetical protein